MAKECSEILKQDFPISFTDTEVCYIAVYLYKNCTNQLNRKKNVLLVCGTGKGLSNLLAIRLGNVFPMMKDSTFILLVMGAAASIFAGTYMFVKFHTGAFNEIPIVAMYPTMPSIVK